MIRLLRKLLRPASRLFLWIPLVRTIHETAGTAAPITLGRWFIQKVLGVNRSAHWPMSAISKASHCSKITIGIGTAPGLSPGCYIQGKNGIVLGDYSLVGPNVVIVSASHSLTDYFEYEEHAPIQIGRYCWLAANCVILPGVVLGDHTVVAAGAVVHRSFPDGYCVLAGVPAKIVKKIDHAMVVEKRNRHEYIGFRKVKNSPN